MATSIDDNAADEKSDKSRCQLLIIRCTSMLNNSLAFSPHPCYSADLLLRQYKRVKSEKKKRFSYRDIKDVYTVILFEKSTKEFHKFPGIYIHHSSLKSDTGLKLDLLQDYTFIALDIFKKTLQNKNINSKLDAWLTFLYVDEAEVIVELSEIVSNGTGTPGIAEEIKFLVP